MAKTQTEARQPVMFEDIFEILQRDPDGKKFDKVSRFACRSDLYEMDLMLDVNIHIYPLAVGDKFTLALAWTLDVAGNKNSGNYDADYAGLSGKPSLMDQYEYVMAGKVYKYKDNQATGTVKVEVYVSFGGLLMQLTGDPKKLDALELDSTVYLLLRKV